MRSLLKVAVNDAFTITQSVWVQDLQMGAPPDYDIPTGDSSAPLIQARPFGSVAEEIHTLREMGQAMRDASICGLGQTASSALESALHRWSLFS